ncbi:MAG: cation transporter [Clostridiales bacterium]|jgi:copper chaperone|nr:cation transporter [Clostridiales bacterium]
MMPWVHAISVMRALQALFVLLRNCVGTAAHVACSSRARSARAALVRAASVTTMPQFRAMLVMRHRGHYSRRADSGRLEIAMEKVILSVEGMSCGHCEIAVQDAIRKLPGIKKVKANRRKKVAAVNYDPALVTPAQIAKAVNDTGYTVAMS